jgi:hypothetical protein
VQQNVPEIYIKGTVWNAQSTPAQYHAQSSAPEELGSGTWFPIKFNKEHVCWVEVCWVEPAGSGGYWQAFRVAGKDLGVDITQGDVEFHLQNTALTNYRESVASSHSSSPVGSPSIVLLIIIYIINYRLGAIIFDSQRVVFFSAILYLAYTRIALMFCECIRVFL